MSDLFECVLHHIEGNETEIQNWTSKEGVETYRVDTFGPDRWIERAALGRLMAIDCLAVILFSVRDTFDLEKERAIVEAWAAELRKAAISGEIQARDPVTLLALTNLPDGWEWLLSTEDADNFIAARGMSWTCSEQNVYLLKQSRDAGTTYKDAYTGQAVKQHRLIGYGPEFDAPEDEAPPTQSAKKPKIPGKLPPVAIGKLAVKAAWEIECETGRRAVDSDVMARLQGWADNGEEPAVLKKSNKEKRCVIWMTTNYKDKVYSLEACQKTLKTWNASRD